MPAESARESAAAAHEDMAATYPANREADVVLRDGSTVRVRPVRADDADGLRRFFEGLSEEATWFRFFSAGTSTASQVAAALNVDYRDRFGLVATRGAGGEIVAHALYARTGDDRAEVAFAIAEGFKGHGLGTILLAHLAEAATDIGIETLEAEVMPENHRMIEVFRESGFPVDVRAPRGRDPRRVAGLALGAGRGALRGSRPDRGRRRHRGLPAPGVGRGGRRLAAARDRRRRALPQPPLLRFRRGPSTRSTRTPTSCSRCAPTRRCRECRDRSISP